MSHVVDAMQCMQVVIRTVCASSFAACSDSLYDTLRKQVCLAKFAQVAIWTCKYCTLLASLQEPSSVKGVNACQSWQKSPSSKQVGSKVATQALAQEPRLTPPGFLPFRAPKSAVSCLHVAQLLMLIAGRGMRIISFATAGGPTPSGPLPS